MNTTWNGEEMLLVWVVKNGTAYHVNGCDIDNELNILGCDNNNSSDWVIIRALNEEGALAFANLYDSNLVEYGNYVCPFCGETHSAINS